MASPIISRRTLLAGAVTGAVATAGCLRRTRSLISRNDPERISLSIATMPADYDPVSIQIARELRSNLEKIGVPTSIELFPPDEFRREVLVNHAFDLAIGRYLADPDPDILYRILHSSLIGEAGWQNPYGFSDMRLDDLLEQQRSVSGEDRRSVIADVLEAIAREQPLTPLAFPIEHRLFRVDRIDGFHDRTFTDTTDILSLSSQDDADKLRLSIGSAFPTKNLNPLSVEYRKYGIVTGLLYDSLAILDRGETVPWLAATIEWTDDSTEITLRDVEWHDGNQVTAKDVDFTYQFLSDTTLGDDDPPVPTPLYRSRIELIDSINVIGKRTLEIEFDCSREVAVRALTIPILPRHVWSDRTKRANDGLLGGLEYTTDALITDNLSPIGSGPYRFDDRSERNQLLLSRFEDHFLEKATDLQAYRPPAHQLVLTVTPSHADAVAAVVEGSVDGTVTSIDPASIDFPDDESVVTIEVPVPSFYQVAYNVRREPLSNPYFRRFIARLLDKNWIVDYVFEGEARPATTPIANDDWVPDELYWDGSDPEVPFFGNGGNLDSAGAREAIIDAGYKYDNEGYLLGQVN